MVERIISAIASIAKISLRNDDDMIDRLHHRYTVSFLVICAAVVSTTQYVGSPIQCWSPAHFTSNHVQFANNMCWVSNTYFLPDHVIAGQPGALKYQISYYQWVPLFLLLQAFLFYLPSLLWRILSQRSGININNLVEAADTIQNALYPERRDKTIKYMIRHLDHYLLYQREYRGGCCVALKHCLAKRLCLVCGNRYGNYLVLIYLTTKVAYFSNALMQLFLLSAFLGTGYKMYGFKVLVDLWTGRNWSGSAKRFPLVTLCDFEIRQMGNIHRHTIQCVLPINLFNEKIFLFLWFWFAFVALATFYSLFRWIWTVGFRYTRTWYVRKHLKVMSRLSRDNDRDLKLANKFAESYLRLDGVFVLKLVAKNSTDLVVADIVAALWDHYRSKPSRGGSVSTRDVRHEMLVESV